ncbi:MAG: Dam family site-specific DNA-(adenine-N6)-methyltransferase [Tildeniella nuda ZEHNDER 1965/U140]|jgi:DNA adenine methylase|nr:Dam family site-specific DNA-(adenine-N6)-methyltransferase [Tildeniella nuda ZEHNDER 1965/U140]
MMQVKVPPIKCQGIKTKLVPFILSQIQWVEVVESRWIEPFLGSGVVAFNLAPKRALLTDSNQHIIAFYQGIQSGEIDRKIVCEFLQEQGDQLLKFGADYYYEVRDRFNQFASPLDFLFLNRACFNGLMRFNSKGGFNVPFCRKPQRFAQSYITKIANQVDWIAKQIEGKDWEFRVANWQETLAEARSDDFIYLDPPYIGRHTDYYNAWNQAEAETLAIVTKQLSCGFAVSMWLENQHRQNSHIQECWSGLEMRVCQHFYHVGSREKLRGAIAEALLIKPGFSVSIDQSLPVELGTIATPPYSS